MVNVTLDAVFAEYLGVPAVSAVIDEPIVQVPESTNVIAPVEESMVQTDVVLLE